MDRERRARADRAAARAGRASEGGRAGERAASRAGARRGGAGRVVASLLALGAVGFVPADVLLPEGSAHPAAPVLSAAAEVVATPPLAAQRWGERERRRNDPIRLGLPDMRTGFTFCRLWYDSVRRERDGLGWSTDYPTGDQNFMIRLAQLTPTPVSRWADGMPGHAVVRATDTDLFKCPFLFGSDVGTVGFTRAEVESLREYLLKGGFLWVDDFWGNAAWAQWSREIGRVLPEYEIVDIEPDHPLYTLVYRLDELPQVPHIGFWRRTGGLTSERGAETAEAHLRGIFDEHGRLLVLMTFNTDIADAWEREGESEEFFLLFSPPAYALAVNVAVWIMTR